MRLSTFFFSLILFATTACGQSYQNDPYNQSNAMPQQTTHSPSVNGNVVMHKVTDPQTGMVSELIPLPAHWKITSNGWVGPNGAEAKVYKGQTFSAAQRPINSIDQIIQEDILPTFSQGGFQHVNTIALPEIARHDQKLAAQYWQAIPTQKFYDAKGVEYKDSEGGRGLIVVHLQAFQSQYGSTVGYYMNVMHAKAAGQYEQLKEEVLYALANYQVTPQAVAAYNQREQQKSQMAWNSHNAKMQNRWNAFNNHQENMRSASQIQDMRHESYMNRSRMQDRGHQKTIDGIRYEESAVNPYDGQQIKVESGYKYYYMNQFGEYFGTNDEFYNPERDPNLNNQEWRRVQYQGGGY